MACTTAIPPLTGFSVVPDINMADSVYCAAVLTYYSELGTFITQSNALAVWIKTTAEAACTAKDAAQTSATNAANSATTAQTAATTATNAAANASVDATRAENAAEVVAALLDLDITAAYIDADGFAWISYTDTGAYSDPFINSDGFLVITKL